MDRILIFLLCFYFCLAKIKINKLDVPSAILYGSQEDVILDCDFETGGDLVTEIKWFMDGNKQVYQWLPEEAKKAQALGKLRDRVDITYKATDDEKTMYRALHITDLTPEISGNYTCKVSGPDSEDEETKRMIIYVTPDESDFDDEILELTFSEETSEITCSAGSYFPQPNITIYITNDNETESALQEDSETVVLNEDGTYNVSSSLKFDASNLTQVFHYTCELNLPGTPYNITGSGIYIQEDNSETQVEEDVFNESNGTIVEDAKENASSGPSLPSALLMTALLSLFCL